MRTKKGYHIRCQYCGKFISYKDLDNGNAKLINFLPDSEFTVETFEWAHIKCIKL